MTVGTTARRGADLLASVLRVIGLLIVVVLVASIVLTFLDANFGSSFASTIKDLANDLDLGPANLFLPPQPKLAVTLNDGTAAIIWYVVTAIVVRLVRRLS